MIPKFLQPEVLPSSSIEIVRARFRSFLTDPATGPRLDAMLADNAALDAATVIPFVDVQIIPPPGPVRPVLDVELEPREDEDEPPYDEACGSACSSWCGYCGLCS